MTNNLKDEVENDYDETRKQEERNEMKIMKDYTTTK